MANHISLRETISELFKVADILDLDIENVFTYAKPFRQAAMRLSNLHEKTCNGVQRYDHTSKMWLTSWTESDESAYENAVAKAESKALRALESMFPQDYRESMVIEFQRDPRGASIKIHRIDNPNGHGVACFW